MALYGVCKCYRYVDWRKDTISHKYNFERKEDNPMREVTNLNNKRVCDVSTDLRVIKIRRKDCITRITANPDGTLNIAHERIKAAV